jgi:hydrogenase/urease accessory protein HupE
MVAGFDHIIPKGLDHILFVIGLFLLTTQLRPLVMQVTMFTLAHTITLVMGALGYINLPGNFVEPLIAASIVFIAVENIFTDKLTPWRPFVIFAFGLLHGLGFASVLGDFGLPSSQFIPALIAFNIGVEIGQLVVIILCFFIVGFWFRNHYLYHRIIVIPASLAIAIIAFYWVLDRTGLLT